MTEENENYQRYKYERAPLQEAIFEVRFINDSFDSAIPGQIYEKVRKEFPQKKDIKQFFFAVGLQEHQFKRSSDIRAPCMQAWNTQQSQCVQVGPGIIAANDLSYNGWETFLPAIRRIVDSYVEVVSPQEVERVGMRFINRILIPEDKVSISNFFQIGISVPPIINNSHSFDITLNSRINGKFDVLTKVRFTSDSLKKGESGVAFVLDLDASVSSLISADSTEIIEVARSAHNRIGAIFEGLLLPPTREILGGRVV